MKGSESVPVPWCTDFLSHIMQATPHAWSTLTLESMPPFMNEWYRAHSTTDIYRDIRTRVDDDYKKLTSRIMIFFLYVAYLSFVVFSSHVDSASLANEQEIVKHFSQPSNTTCLW